ncbi:MAG: hypothetical protein LBB59_00965 [Campylobacteraceae bacterium]|jgi:hypothetical protein|nr:hypothetical protein [Campylobacteraceae bacterium]
MYFLLCIFIFTTAYFAGILTEKYIKSRQKSVYNAILIQFLTNFIGAKI